MLQKRNNLVFSAEELKEMGATVSGVESFESNKKKRRGWMSVPEDGTVADQKEERISARGSREYREMSGRLDEIVERAFNSLAEFTPNLPALTGRAMQALEDISRVTGENRAADTASNQEPEEDYIIPITVESEDKTEKFEMEEEEDISADHVESGNAQEEGAREETGKGENKEQALNLEEAGVKEQIAKSEESKDPAEAREYLDPDEGPTLSEEYVNVFKAFSSSGEISVESPEGGSELRATLRVNNFDDVPVPPPVSADDRNSVPAPPPVSADDRNSVPAPPPVSADDRNSVPAPPPVSADDRNSVPAPPPVSADDRNSVPAPPPVPADERNSVVAPPPVPADDRNSVVAPPPVPADDRNSVVAPPPVPADDRNSVVAPPPVPAGDRNSVAAPPPVPADDRNAVPVPPPVPEGKQHEEKKSTSTAEVSLQEEKPQPAVEMKEEEGGISVPISNLKRANQAGSEDAGAAKKGEKKKTRKKKKPWFDDFFNDDYLLTLPFETSAVTSAEAEFIEKQLDLPRESRLLDLACGYGRHAVELAKRGYNLVGLDNSLPMLLKAAEMGEQHGVEVNFMHGDMKEMTFEGEFQGVYCFNTSFGYFDDDTNKKVLGKVFNALNSGGRFLLEVVNRDFLLTDLPLRVWWEGEGCVVMEEVEFNYFTSRVESNRSVVFNDGRQIKRNLSIRVYSLHELGKLMHQAGFVVRGVTGNLETSGRFFGPHSPFLIIKSEKK